MWIDHDFLFIKIDNFHIFYNLSLISCKCNVFMKFLFTQETQRVLIF
ncbi:hypothetical protein LDG_8290 [Legionella drancourtii LLAP12]|uniref:Uncharacterized protein n=1 Tax=Legionella drancourtii LLAP12 TaxID=658187 RepID=G9ESL9_9GAMM|nr:hypothetical protein LDG_8290 [Legionella drancourtii LLAP12]